MELQQLRYFAKAAQLGSFTKAAEACLVSQPSLSQQIAKLEQELGQPLFERLGRGAKLTEVGKAFKDRVEQILKLVDEAKASAADAPDAGRLVVAAIPTIAPYFLPQIIAAFAAAHPKAHVELVEEPTSTILSLCGNGDVDCGVAALPLRAIQYVVEPLFEEELLAVLPAGHPLAEKKRLRLEDLVAEPFVLLNDAHCLSELTMAFCKRKSVVPFATARLHQLATVLELVRLGHGVSLIPAMAAAGDHCPERVYRSLDGDKPTRTIALVWNPERFQTKLFHSFLSWMKHSACVGPKQRPLRLSSGFAK
jgi:LysR family transcriptional regulator, hydrogen peroxide-inducible genes activator